MKTKYLLVVLVSAFVMTAKAQIKKTSTRAQFNPFQQVKVNDSVRHKLAEFLWISAKDSSGIMINHVLGKDKTNQYQFVEGIYRFRLNKIPAITYHFVYTKAGGVQIVEAVAIDRTLEAVLDFFKVNETTLSSQDKLDYQSTLLIDLKEREKMLTPGFHGDYEIKASKKNAVKKQFNPFEMVHVPDSVRSKLYGFLWKERNDSLKAGISIYHILGKDKANHYQFEEGIYSFRMMGPHFPLYYFIYTKRDGLEIITHYDLEGLLTQVAACFKRNLNSFTEVERIAYIQAMIKDLHLRNASNGDELIRK